MVSRVSEGKLPNHLCFFPSFYIYAYFSTLDLCIRHVRVLKYLYMFADQRRSTSVWCLILKGGVYSPWSWRQQPQVVRPEETSSNVRHMIHSLKMDRPIFVSRGVEPLLRHLKEPSEK